MQITRSILTGESESPDALISVQIDSDESTLCLHITDYMDDAGEPKTIVCVMDKAEAEALGRLLLDASSDA